MSGPATPALAFARLTGQTAAEIITELTEVYARVYDVPPYIGDPFFSVDTFGSRLTAAFEMEGFELVTARLQNGALAGYVHGVTLTADRPWWVSLRDVIPDEVRKAAEAGDVFWLRELMVLAEHTGRGIGRALHDEMVKGRTESWTTLTCITDNQPARDAYPRWGYEVLPQTIKHAQESPVYAPMLLRPGFAAY
ncbi:GNAT family N-acetyltransferase [Streptomyces sp. NPDC049906]|uniref:GNAT family N-acetyltransferase n=1 Tax=Streptomyces sp. NPDC049906 TaxID=3155656 RepID=UPI003425376A